MARILVEGIDGSSKTTTARKVCELAPHVTYRNFPSDDTPVGHLIRQVLRGEVQIAERAMFYLFLAENEDIALPENCVVDRHSCVSSLVYQTKHWHHDLIVSLTTDARKMFDKIYIVDVPVAIALERIEQRGTKKTLYEQNLDPIRRRYLEVADMIRATVLDGTRPVEENARRIIKECGL